jgi:uncharacterized protein Veg
MIKPSKSIVSAKEIIEKLQGKNVDVKVSLGRNKYVTYKGRLDAIYPALFTVTPENNDYHGKTSYSYSEYLCGDVIIKERVTKKAQ